MLNSNNQNVLKIDPWVASSLLQKAIRRGEGERACQAAQSLYRHRGKGIWKRLVNIAFEDVGIANPRLLLELVSLASDEDLRATSGTEKDLLTDICIRLAASPKDRSADYVYTAATLWEPCLEDLETLRSRGFNSLLSVGGDKDQPVFHRALALLELFTVDGAGEKLLPPTSFRKLFEKLFETVPSDELLNATFLAGHMRAHPIILMPLLLQSALPKGADVTEATLTTAEDVGGVPLYSFDKFTSLGKRAIGLFSRECSEVRSVLDKHCAESDWHGVAAMAVFYTEGFLVARRLCWSQSQYLERIGLKADFAHARANLSGVADITEVVELNLPALNQIRRRLLAARGAQ